MRKLLLLLFTFFISIHAFSQSADALFKNAKKTSNNKARITYYLKAGDAYQKEKNLSKALKSYQRAENELKTVPFYKLECEAKSKIAAINQRLGRENHTITKLTEVEQIALKNDDETILKDTYLKLYTLYSNSKNDALSERYLKLLQSFEKHESNQNIVAEMAQKVAQVEEEKIEIHENLQSAKKEVSIKEKALEEKSRTEAKMRKLAIDQKSKIDVLSLENQNKKLMLSQQETQLKSERLTKILMYGGLIILTIIGSLIYYNFHLHKKDHAIIQAQNKQISDSISYAQKIQQNIIPSEHDLKHLFSDAFIIYKPKDVVSGDFPWHFVKGNDIYLAAVDCTGHGVPGAMLAVVGTLLLNDIANDQEDYSTGVILDRLHESVKTTLKQNDASNKSNDGMDIALCKYNTKTRALSYSGAHRPIYLFQNGKMNRERGSSFPIGGLQYEKRRKPFKTFEVQLNEGDSFFISSDGLPDQMDSTYENKYGNRFYDNLVAPILTSGGSLTKVKTQITEDVIKFQGTAYQLDDMLLIGVKV